MLFAVFVVQRDILLETVGDVLVGDGQLAVGRPGEDVEAIEQFAGVAA